MKKSLTKLPYLKLLATIGSSEIPLTSQQIINGMIEKGYIDSSSKKDVFRMLKELVPEPYTIDKQTYLCSWNDTLSDNNDARYLLLRKIDNIFKLGWDVGERKSKNKNDHVDNIDNSNKNNQASFVISEKNDYSLLTIRYGRYSVIALEVPRKPNSESSLTLLLEQDESIRVVEKKEIITKTIGNTLRIYLKKSNPDRTRFLKVTLNEKIRNKHPLVNKYWEHIKDKEVHTLLANEDVPDKIAIDIMKNDTIKNLIYSTTFWKYELNFRGFLLYILAETAAERNNIKRLKQVISSKSIIKIAPFLISHEYLDVLGFNTVRALNEIAVEFQYHLGYGGFGSSYTFNYNEEYLFYNVLESYFAKVEYNFNLDDNILSVFQIKRLGSSKYAYFQRKMLKYRLSMMDLLKRWIKKVDTNLDDRYRIYSDKYGKYNPNSS
jgi:hypothetical protein